jgi:hypothetical protein
MTIGALAFLSPWLLTGLIALPIIYWLLRTVPPRPRQVLFPATRILIGLRNRERTPAKTPWWLMLIRLLAAALIILALAEPVLNPNRETALRGSGPVAIVVDNTWAAAPHWAERARMVERLIAEAESRSRAVAIVPTAITGKAPSLRVEPPQSARSAAAALQPQPFPPVRETVGQALEGLLSREADASVVWLTDGLDHDGKAGAFATLLGRLGRGSFSVIETGTGREPIGLTAALGQGGRLEGVVQRTQGGARDGIVHAFSERGQRLGEATFRLAPGETRAVGTFDLPLELRNQVVRIEVAGERSAGAVHLLDSRNQWHRVGLISGDSRDQEQPLLGPLYYIARALGPYAELVEPKDANAATALETVIKRNASVIIMADIGQLSGSLKKQVEDWVARGGVLVRFAGPRLEKGGDDLIPVPLRLGGRTLGGALSWSTPQPLGQFPDDGLFAGLPVPPDVAVTRQVLADPARLVPQIKVWARLRDGTPLVTARERGQGQVILFHVTANAEWSNLPLSGLFVEMLRRISTLGRIDSGVRTGGGTSVADTAAAETGTETGAILAPLQSLDGYGTLRSPPPTAQAIPAGRLAETRPTADYPPGYYGPQGTPRALNLLDARTTLRPLPALPASTERRAYDGQVATPLKPSLMTAALMLLFADIVAVILLQIGGQLFGSGRPAGAPGAGTAGLSGRLRGIASGLRARGSTGAGVLLAAAVGSIALVWDSTHGHAQWQPLPQWQPQPRWPQQQPFNPFDRLQRDQRQVQIIRPTRPVGPLEEKALAATSKVSFGYVVTGDQSVDNVSREGLNGLIRILAARTSVEQAAVSAIRVDEDDITFFPILYWPVLPNAQALPEQTLAKIDAYMKEGGLIIFDTRDFGQGLPSGFNVNRGGDTGTALQRLIGRLDIPRLEPVPEAHVLTRAFYLLRAFPGRWDGGQLWVEADAAENPEQGRKARRADGVTSIIVTSNDFASAWALDERNRPLYPVVPGGEGQRETSFRAGINIVMHALTGNYKADQVHVPALLDRLGQ